MDKISCCKAVLRPWLSHSTICSPIYYAMLFYLPVANLRKLYLFPKLMNSNSVKNCHPILLSNTSKFHQWFIYKKTVTHISKAHRSDSFNKIATHYKYSWATSNIPSTNNHHQTLPYFTFYITSLPIPLSTNLVSFTALLKTSMICHRTFMMLQP